MKLTHKLIVLVWRAKLQSLKIKTTVCQSAVTECILNVQGFRSYLKAFY